MRVKSTLTTLLNRFGNEKNLKMKAGECVGKMTLKLWILYHKTNKVVLTVLCSVVKHLGLSGYSTQEVGRNTRLTARVSPYTSFVLSPLPACFTTEQSLYSLNSFEVREGKLRGY